MSELKQNRLEAFQDKLMEITGKFQSNHVIQAVTQGMMSAMGVTIAGSIVNLIFNLPIPGMAEFLQSIGLYQLFSDVIKLYQLTVPLTSFLIAYAYAKIEGQNPLPAGVLGFASYMILCPITMIDGNEALLFTDINGQNYAASIVIGVLAAVIYVYTQKKHWVINMPDTIPEFVRVSLGSIPAGLVCGVPFIIIRGILQATPFGTFSGLFNALIGAPIAGLGNTIGGQIIFTILVSGVWWFGIHNMTVFVFVMMAMTAATTENTMAIANGLPAPYMLNLHQFLFPSQYLGGPGCTIGLAICALLFAKSDRYKVQSKIMFIPSLFNIVEPAMFGVPIILNLTFLLPLIAAPVACLLLEIIGMKLGLFTTPVVSANSFLPGPINALFSGSGIMFVLYALLCYVVVTLIYYPFFKIADKQALKEEEAAKAAAEAE